MLAFVPSELADSGCAELPEVPVNRGVRADGYARGAKSCTVDMSNEKKVRGKLGQLRPALAVLVLCESVPSCNLGQSCLAPARSVESGRALASRLRLVLPAPQSGEAERPRPHSRLSTKSGNTQQGSCCPARRGVLHSARRRN